MARACRQVVPNQASARLLAEQGLMKLLLELATWMLDGGGGGTLTCAVLLSGFNMGVHPYKQSSSPPGLRACA